MGVSDEVQINELIDAMRSVLDRVSTLLGSTRTKQDELYALCPFHEDRLGKADRSIGSFSVNTRTGNFYCWSCGAQGGIRRLVRQLGINDIEANRLLKAVDEGVLSLLIEQTTSARRDEVQEMKVLPEGLIAPFREFYPRLMLERGHPQRILDALEVGLDVHRLRVTFPIRKITGELVAVQSRTVDESGNSLRWKFYRREIFDDLPDETIVEYGLEDYEPPRRTVFFNEHNVLAAMWAGRLNAPIVLTEGPGHALRALTCGFPAIASFGTQLGSGQKPRLIEVLKRVALKNDEKPTIIIATDGDEPGRVSALRAAMDIGRVADARIAQIPAGKDPEDLTPPQLRPIIESALTLREYMELTGPDGDLARRQLDRAMQQRIDAADRRARLKRWEERKNARTRGLVRPEEKTISPGYTRNRMAEDPEVQRALRKIMEIDEI